jgi:signal transduction histidine kinase
VTVVNWSTRRSTIHRLVEPTLAFLVSAVFFLLAAAATPVRHHLIPIVLLGGVYVYVVYVAATRLGPLYAVPLAIAGGLAFDSFFIPPTRPFGADNWQNWLVVGIYVAMGVLIGIVGTRSQRRTDVLEQARGVLADEQAALRRVATLVAQGVPSSEVFAAVAREVGQLLGAESTHVGRYESDHTATDVGSWSASGAHVQVGVRVTLDDTSVAGLVHRLGRPARLDSYDEASDEITGLVDQLGIRSSVAAPIIVDGRLWGVMVASAKSREALPPETEPRIAAFTELVATAISNTEARADLAASRARIVTATDEERRRVVRDLHDGAQQRLVHTVVTLKLADRALQADEETAPRLVADALDQAESAMVELRELAHGILPSVLTYGGLRAGVEALAVRAPVPVHVDVCDDRFAGAVEATAYFVVAEALTNVAKHAQAGSATVTGHIEDGSLRIEISDDGIGAADPHGHGLLGLADRVASRDGVLEVLSTPGEGTRVVATLPLAA